MTARLQLKVTRLDVKSALLMNSIFGGGNGSINNYY